MHMYEFNFYIYIFLLFLPTTLITSSLVSTPSPTVSRKDVHDKKHKTKSQKVTQPFK